MMAMFSMMSLAATENSNIGLAETRIAQCITNRINCTVEVTQVITDIKPPIRDHVRIEGLDKDKSIVRRPRDYKGKEYCAERFSGFFILFFLNSPLTGRLTFATRPLRLLATVRPLESFGFFAAWCAGPNMWTKRRF